MPNATMGPIPCIGLALVLELGPRRELLPVCDRSLLVDAAVVTLRGIVEEAHRETDPVAADVKAQEAVILGRVLRRLIPEIRVLLESSAPAPGKEALVQ